MATVLDLVKYAAARLVLPDVPKVVGNPDAHVQQLVAAMLGAADDFTDRYPVNRQVLGGQWLRGRDGRTLSMPAADTDIVLIDEKLMRSAVLWRWQHDNGFDYAENFRAAEERLAQMALAYTRSQRGRSICT